MACGSHIYPSKIMHFAGVDQEQCNDVYNYALDRGINTIVTNTAYKTAEDKLYKAIGHRREEFNLSIGTDFRSAMLVKKDIEKSLERFHTDQIDIYQLSGIRRVDAIERTLKPDGGMRALLQAKREGKIGHIGVTGHNLDALVKAIETGEVECCQFVLNPVMRQGLTKLVTVAKEYDVDLFAMRPLEDGWLKGRAREVIRFLVASPVDVIISGSYTREVLDENISIVDQEPREGEWRTLLQEAETVLPSECMGCMLCKGHWVDYDGAACPHWIDVYDLLAIRNFRKRYGLPPDQEARYRAAAAKIQKCDECMVCEAVCIFNVPIVQILRDIQDEIHPKSQ